MRKKIFKLLKRSFLNFKKKSSVHTYIILLIFIFGLCLRLYGTNPGYPLTHQDEPKVVDSARNIALYLDFKPLGFPYGQLIPIIDALGFVIFFIPGFFIIFSLTNFPEILNRGIVGFLEYFRYQLGYETDLYHHFVYWARYESAFLSSLVILMVYFLGKKLFGKNAGLIAAFLTAVNFRHVLGSFVARVESPSALFTLLSVFLSLRLLKNQSWKTYLLAGTGLTLAMSVKFFMFVIPVFIFCYLYGMLNKKKPIFEKLKNALFNKKFFIAIAWGILLFFIINPYIILDYKRAYFDIVIFGAGSYGLASGIPLFSEIKTLVPLYYLWWVSPGPILSISIILGMIYGLFRYRFNSFILLLVILSFLFVFIGIGGSPFIHTLTLIMPFLSFFPAILICDTCKFLFPKHIFPIILATVIIGWQSMQLSFTTAYYFSLPHNEPAMRDWIDQNWHDKVKVFNLGTALPSTGIISEIPHPFTEFHQFVSMEEIKETPAQWISISNYWPVQATEYLWIHSNMLKETFFNKDLFFKLINNFYVGLATKEIGQYRIKEFIKPSYYSYDRNLFLAKVPDFWKPSEDKQVKSFDFSNTKEQKEWKKSSIDDGSLRSVIFSTLEDATKAISLDGNKCNSNTQTIMYSPLIPVEQKKLHTLTAFGLRSYAAKYAEMKTGFLRLDFFDNINSKPNATYVSRLLSGLKKWQKLTVVGFSPIGSKYARVGIQFDICFPNEKYYFKQINLYESDEIPFPSSKNYPYFQQKLPENFIWRNRFE